MIKDNQTHLNRAHVVVDGLLVAGSYMLSYYIKFESFIGDRNPAGHLAMETYFSALYFLVPGFLFLYYLVNLYTSRRALKLWDEFVDIVQANIVGVIGFYVILFMLKQNDFSRTMIAIFAIINVIVTTIAHGLLRKFLRYIRKKGYNIKHILLVGYSRAAEGYISRILENPQWGYDVAGILDDFVPVVAAELGLADDVRIIIGGYSLAAFFALWCMTETDRFSGVAAASPSVWFPGWIEHLEKWAGADTSKVPVYLSLGDKEPKTRSPLMKTVGDRIIETKDILSGCGAETVFEWNQGNHFREPDVRTAKGFMAVMEMCTE